jgi:hypothetical protein
MALAGPPIAVATTQIPNANSKDFMTILLALALKVRAFISPGRQIERES